MTDARLRGAWLGKMRFDDLSDAAWRIFTSALMWSAEQGTDGVIPTRYVRQLHPLGVMEGANSELVDAGVWKRTPDGYALIDWAGELGQSTAEQVEKYREKNRVKAARQRQRQAERVRALAEARDVEQGDEPVTADSATGVVPPGTHPGYVGRGNGRGRGEGNGRGNSAVTEWPVRKPGGGWVDRGDGSFEEVIAERAG